MKMGRLREFKIDSKMFPDISKGKISYCVHLVDFHMYIPPATIVPQSG